MLLLRIASVCALVCPSLPLLAVDPPGTARVVFVGDIMLDGGPGHIVTNGGDPFAPVASILRDADLTIGNLECAITRDGHAVDKPYTFKGPKSALPLLKKLTLVPMPVSAPTFVSTSVPPPPPTL